MRYKLADDAKPQMTLLVTAMAVSMGLWAVSLVLPAASYLFYPLQLFATFIHEGSHVLATLITGNSVQSMTVSPDTSGVVWSQASGLSSLLISSSGYLGTTAFGILLMAWIRYGYSARRAMVISAGIVAALTAIFGCVAPFWNLLANVSFGSVVFTVFSGAVLTIGLLAIAKFASQRWVNFAVAFLSVQCLLNAFFSLKELFVISAVTTQGSDAANMAAATGVPSLIWVFTWTIISLVMLTIGLRLFASRKPGAKSDSVFEG
ncbi:MAG: M50 family metallopeptidase [Pyrinomonadaceae bacterium]